MRTPMRVIDLVGSPREIGAGHGRALAVEIDGHLQRWRSRLADVGVADPQGWITGLVRDSWFVTSVLAEAPDLADEVEGIAEGAGISMIDAWFLQLMDESWAALADRRAGSPDAPPGCTSFAVVGGMRSWSGQTMDLEGFRAGTEAVLRIRPTGSPQQLVVTMAGCIGLFGATQAGFAVLVNALPQVPARRTGFPVAAVVRQALAAPNVGAATAFVRDAPHATGQHYLVAGNEQLAGFECSPVGVAAVMPGAQRLWHTNHPLVGYVPEPDDAESDARWEAVRPLMAMPSWGRTRSRSLLESPPVCRRPAAGTTDSGAASTFAAAVVEQSMRPTELWVTAGPPTPDAWQHVPWHDEASDRSRGQAAH